MGFLDPNSWANALSDDPTGAKAAAQTQADWQNRAIDLQQAAQQQAMQQQLPWLQGGQGAASQLASRLGVSTSYADPRYTRLSADEIRTLNASAPAIRRGQASAYDINKPLYRGPSGELTTTPPTISTSGLSANDPRNLLNVPQFSFDPSKVNVTADPGYQFRLKTGVDALTAAGSAAGNLGSGNLGTALTQYGQNLGSQEYGAAYARDYGRAMDEYNAALQAQNQVYNRLAGLSGTGQVSAGQIGAQGLDTAANIGGMMGQIGSGFGNAAIQNRFLQNQAQGQLSQQAGQGLGNWLMADSGYGGNNASWLGTQAFGNTDTYGSLYSNDMSLENASMSDSSGWFNW